jgi:hypothetical protein
MWGGVDCPGEVCEGEGGKESGGDRGKDWEGRWGMEGLLGRLAQCKGVARRDDDGFCFGGVCWGVGGWWVVWMRVCGVEGEIDIVCLV